MSRTNVVFFTALSGLAVYSCGPDFNELSSGGGSDGGGTAGRGADEAGSGGSGLGGRGGNPAGGVGGNSGAGEGGSPNTAGEGGEASTSGGTGGGAGDGSGRGGTAGTNTGASAGTGGTGGTVVLPPLDCGACSFGAGITMEAERLIGDDFTFEAWIKTATSRAGTAPFQGTPLLHSDVPGPAADFEVAILGGKLAMNVGGPTTMETVVIGTSDIATDQWVHVAVTRDVETGLVVLYVNGQIEATENGSTVPLTAFPLVLFGNVPRRFEAFLVGLMDDIKLWTTVRTQEQIRADMLEPPDTNDSGLVGYYTCDELSGTVLPDASPMNNDAAVSPNFVLVPSDVPSCLGGGGGAGGAGGAEGGTGGADAAGADAGGRAGEPL